MKQKWKKVREDIRVFDFEATYKVERDPRIKIKLLALYHFQIGKSLNEISRLVIYDVRMIRSWILSFVEFDYEGLIEREGRGRKPRLPCSEEDNFKNKLDELQSNKKGGRLTGLEIQNFLAERFDCCYSRSGVYALLDRLNIVWMTGRSKHPKSSEEAMEEFKKVFPEEVKKIKESIDSDRVEIWWQDESRIGQQGSLSRVWASKGSRPRVVRQKQYLSTYIFGAVCPDRDIGCAMVLPECNSGMMQIHLDQISEHIQEGYHGIILMDRASWHTTETLNIPENIALMPLPAYSPELNPMEQVWQQLRKIKLSNIVFEDYNDIVDACCKAWNCFCDEDGNIQSLCTRSWAET